MGYIISFLAGAVIFSILSIVPNIIRNEKKELKIYSEGYYDGRADEALGNGGVM